MSRAAIVRIAATVGGLLFLAVAVATSIDELRSQVVPGWDSIGRAFVLIVAGLGAVSGSWVVFNDASPTWLDVRGFLLAQPAKYLPGGFAIAVNQVLFASRGGASVAHSAGRFLWHSVALAVGGISVGGLLLAVEGRRWLGALSLGLAALGFAVLVRGGLPERVNPVLSRLRKAVLAGQDASFRIGWRRKLLSVLLGAAGIAGLAGGFASLARDLLNAGSVESVAAFGFAWAAGFVLVVVPAGIGVREAALAYVLTSRDVGEIVAVGVLHRLLQAVAEGLIAVMALAVEARSRTSAVETGTPPEQTDAP